MFIMLIPCHEIQPSPTARQIYCPFATAGKPFSFLKPSLDHLTGFFFGNQMHLHHAWHREQVKVSKHDIENSESTCAEGHGVSIDASRAPK